MFNWGEPKLHSMYVSKWCDAFAIPFSRLKYFAYFFLCSSKDQIFIFAILGTHRILYMVFALSHRVCVYNMSNIIWAACMCVCTLESDFHCFGFIWIKIWSSSVWTFISFCLLYDTRDRRTHVLVLVHARFNRIAQAKYSKWWNGNKEPNMTKTKWQHEPCNEIWKKKTATANSMSEQDSEQVNEWILDIERFSTFSYRAHCLLLCLPAYLFNISFTLSHTVTMSMYVSIDSIQFNSILSDSFTLIRHTACSHPLSF